MWLKKLLWWQGVLELGKVRAMHMVVCDNKLYLTPADKCVPIFVVPDLIPDHWGFVDV